MYNDGDSYTAGMNPAFLKRVREKREAEARARQLAEMERKKREEEAARRAALKAAREELSRKRREEAEAREAARAKRRQFLEEARRAAEKDIRFRSLISEIGSRLSASKPPSIKEIIAATEAKYGLHPGDIIGPSRNHKIVAARHEALAKSRIARPDLSTPALGRIFHRDHTSILHALNKMGVHTARAA